MLTHRDREHTYRIHTHTVYTPTHKCKMKVWISLTTCKILPFQLILILSHNLINQCLGPPSLCTSPRPLLFLLLLSSPLFPVYSINHRSDGQARETICSNCITRPRLIFQLKVARQGRATLFQRTPCEHYNKKTTSVNMPNMPLLL